MGKDLGILLENIGQSREGLVEILVIELWFPPEGSPGPYLGGPEVGHVVLPTTPGGSPAAREWQVNGSADAEQGAALRFFWPPPILSRTRNSVGAPRASPTASPTIAPWNRSNRVISCTSTLRSRKHTHVSALSIAKAPAIRFTAFQMTRSPSQLPHRYRHDRLAQRKRILAQAYHCTLAYLLLQRVQHAEHLAPIALRRR